MNQFKNLMNRFSRRRLVLAGGIVLILGMSYGVFRLFFMSPTVSFETPDGIRARSVAANDSTTALEVERGTIGGAASIESSAAASDGRYVLFGAPPIASNFVQVCGLKLCLDGKEFFIKGATTYGQLDDPAKEVALAKSAGINTLEIVEYERDYRNINDTMSEPTWQRIDALVAEAKKNGLHVIINFSSYGHSLAKAGRKPTTANWEPFLKFVAERTNTKTGVQYRNEPTIAMVKLYGEIAAPNYGEPQKGTTAETTAFFKKALAYWKSKDVAPNILASTGGFSYINDPNSGIDWKTIVNDPNNAVCDVEVNAYPDRNISVPNMSTYCKQLGKPWFLAAWSACYRAQKDFNEDINSWPSDQAMALHVQDMYAIALDRKPTAPAPVTAAAGTDFWNLGSVPARLGSCDLGPQFPKAWQAVKENNL